MAKGFDLSALLGDVSDFGTERKQIEYIELEKIDPDPKNFYSLDGLEELAGNIELLGLQQPLVVRPGEGEHVTVVSGHRRRAAIQLIKEGGNPMFDEGVPCIREAGDASAALQELRLIYANSATRVLSAAELSKQAERVEALLYELKEQGVEFPGRMRDHVAQACQVSKSKLARLHAIRKNLIPELLAQFNAFELVESAAYELQKLPAEVQKEIYAAASKKRNYSFRQLRGDCAARCVEYSKKYMQEAKCGDGDECDHHLPRFVYTALSQYGYEYCDGDCCLQCYRRNSCSWSCAKAKAQKKAEAEQASKAKETEKRREEKAQKKYREESRAAALRLLPVVEAAGLKDGDRLPGCGYSYDTVEHLRAAASGEFGNEHLYGARTFIPFNFTGLKAMAKGLDCTTDFLLGLTDEPRPVPKINTKPEWQVGEPENEGKYYCKVELEGVSVHQTLVYSNGWKLLSGGHDLDAACRVIGWWPLPEV